MAFIVAAYLIFLKAFMLMLNLMLILIQIHSFRLP